MLRIRLTRFGTKNTPAFRLSVSERAKDARGKVLEYLGSYNPRQQPKLIQLDGERIKYWLSKGAQATPTIHNLLIDQGIITGKKVHAFRAAKPVKAVKPEVKIAAPAKQEAPTEQSTPKAPAEQLTA